MAKKTIIPKTTTTTESGAWFEMSEYWNLLGFEHIAMLRRHPPPDKCKPEW